jgi:hypothetical protein
MAKNVYGIECAQKNPHDLSDEELGKDLLNAAFVQVSFEYALANDIQRIWFGDKIPYIHTHVTLEPLLVELEKRVSHGPFRPHDTNKQVLIKLYDGLANVKPGAETFDKAVALRKVVDGRNAAEDIENNQIIEQYPEGLQRDFARLFVAVAYGHPKIGDPSPSKALN